MIKQKAAHNTKNERKEHMWWMQFAVVNSIYGNGLKIAKVIWCLFKAASHETQAKIDKKKWKRAECPFIYAFSRESMNETKELGILYVVEMTHKMG